MVNKKPVVKVPLTRVVIVMRADAATIQAALEARRKVDALLAERAAAYERIAALERQVDEIMGEPGAFVFPAPPVPVAAYAAEAPAPAPKPASAAAPAPAPVPAPAAGGAPTAPAAHGADAAARKGASASKGGSQN